MAASSCRIKGDGAASMVDAGAGDSGATASTRRGDSAATSPSLGRAANGRGGGDRLTAEVGFVTVLTSGALASSALTDAIVGRRATGARTDVAGAEAGLLVGGVATGSARGITLSGSGLVGGVTGGFGFGGAGVWTVGGGAAVF